MDSYLQGENFFYKPTDRSPKSRTTQAGWDKPHVTGPHIHGKFQQRNTCTSPAYSISVYLLVLVLHSCTYLFEGAFAGRQFFVAQLTSNITSSPQLGLAIGTLKMVIH